MLTIELDTILLKFFSLLYSSYHPIVEYLDLGFCWSADTFKNRETSRNFKCYHLTHSPLDKMATILTDDIFK